MNEKPKKVVLLASVITEENRLKRLKQMIESVKQQSVKPDYFYVSIFVDPSLNLTMSMVSDMFTGVATNILYQRKPKKQFVQIYELCLKISSQWLKDEISHTWVSFTDDDDLWSPIRMSLYQDALINAYENSPQQFNKISGIKVCQYNTHEPRKYCNCEINDAKDVFKGIKCGCVKYGMYTEREQNKFVEYHHWMTKFALLQEFLQRCLFFVFENRYCDVLFSYFLNNYKPDECVTISVFSNPNEWAYFYRNGSKEYSCVTSKPKHEQLGLLSDLDPYLDVSLEQLEIIGLMKSAYINLEKTLQSAKEKEYPMNEVQTMINLKRKHREDLAKRYSTRLYQIDELSTVTSLTSQPQWKPPYVTY